ncbi:hypothetical protein [Leptospira inadai]|uniref:hypothetical protein n=1 Tax=Leptospira inadai TaxID=29506 RepID=UPI0002886F84|nr:hypothetical protein [Leptospira inadai]
MGAFSTLGYGKQGVYNDVSYFVPEKAPMTEAEREQAAESARNNLLNNILGGIGYVAGRVGDFAKGIWDGMFGDTLMNPNLTVFDPTKNTGKPPAGWVEGGDGKFYHPNSMEAAALLMGYSINDIKLTGSLDPIYPSHENATKEAAQSLGYSEKEIESLINGVRVVDMPEGVLGLMIMWVKEKLGVDPMTSNDPSLQTHYGKKSFYHNQEAEAGIAPEITKDKILNRIEDLLNLARKYESNTNGLRGSENRTIALELLGNVLHTIQDSFSDAHVVRDRSKGGFGEIVQFQIYTGQDHRLHGMADYYHSETFAFSASVIASYAVLDMYSSGKSVSDIVRYLDRRVYNLSTKATSSGVSDEYRKY